MSGIIDEVTIGDCRLILGDCLECLPLLPKCDIVLTDPPYMNMAGNANITFDSGVAKLKSISKTVADPWDANLDWVPLAWEKAEKGFFSFCSFHFISELRISVPSKPTTLISWYQRNAMPSAANAPQFNVEYCWAFRKKTGLDWRKLKSHYDIPRLQAGCMATERELNNDGTASHPSQKPVKLIEEILKIGGESVLDCFMGTGTTGVACVNLGRKFIGIERERKYFDIAVERIKQAYAQQRLFADAPATQPKQETLL